MRIRCSAAGRIVQCPGSLVMCELHPGEDTPAAIEGTMAHAVASGHVTDCTDEEMLEGAEMYRDAINNGVIPLHVEEYVSCATIHPENGGTPDAWYFDRARLALHVFDYKYGHGHVEVFQNYQLMNYVAGILDTLELSECIDQLLTVHMTIVQPRSFHRDGPVRTWTCKASDLRGYFNHMRAAYAEALGPNPVCNTGPECKYCPARHACEALLRSGYDATERAGQSVPLELSNDALGRELQLLQRTAVLLDARITGLAEQALRVMRAGGSVPGQILEQGMGREKWAKSVDEVVALGELMGVALEKKGVITPKQAIKAGIPAPVVRSYSETPRGEVKLVPSGKRLAAIFGRG